MTGLLPCAKRETKKRKKNERSSSNNLSAWTVNLYPAQTENNASTLENRKKVV